MVRLKGTPAGYSLVGLGTPGSLDLSRGRLGCFKPHRLIQESFIQSTWRCPHQCELDVSSFSCFVGSDGLNTIHIFIYKFYMQDMAETLNYAFKISIKLLEKGIFSLSFCQEMEDEELGRSGFIP